MFFDNSYQSADKDTTDKRDSWDNIFALAVDQYYDSTQDKDAQNKKGEEQHDFLPVNFCFDEDLEKKVDIERELSDNDSTSTDNESSYFRSNSSCQSLNFFYEEATQILPKKAKKISSVLNEDWETGISAVKKKYNQIFMNQKIINTKRMMMANMLKTQALAQMMASQISNVMNSNEQVSADSSPVSQAWLILFEARLSV